MQSESRLQQTKIEIGGAIGVFSDGTLQNSDYDIIYDIDKINAIIFSEKIPYQGKVNPTNKSLERFLRGDKAPNLTGSGYTNSEDGGSKDDPAGPTDPTNPDDTGEADQSNPLPWANVCPADGNGGNTPSPIDQMADDAFTRELNDALLGQNPPSNTE